MFYECLIMFKNVLRCLVSHAMIGNWRLHYLQSLPCDCQSPQGSAIMRESNPMLNSILNGDWSNSVHRRQFPKGCPNAYIFILPYSSPNFHPIRIKKCNSTPKWTDYNVACYFLNFYSKFERRIKKIKKILKNWNFIFIYYIFEEFFGNNE